MNFDKLRRAIEAVKKYNVPPQEPITVLLSLAEQTLKEKEGRMSIRVTLNRDAWHAFFSIGLCYSLLIMGSMFSVWEELPDTARRVLFSYVILNALFSVFTEKARG